MSLVAPRDPQETHFSFSEYYLTSLRVGFRALVSTEWLAGLKRIARPLSYPRACESRIVLHELAPRIKKGRVLDIGSPKVPLLLVLVKAYPELEFYSTDILPNFIRPTEAFLRYAGLAHRMETVHLQTEDTRRLRFPDNHFDWVYSVSVIEHVADEKQGQNGDSLAMQEIARVLKPGGVATLTVPFDPQKYWEEYKNGTVYERKGIKGSRNFYQRHYDLKALEERLIKPTGLECENRVFFGEPGRLGKLWKRVPSEAKLAILPAQAVLGNVFFRRVDDDNLVSARGVALRLVKPM